MATAHSGPPQRFLRTPEAARILGLSGRTLEKHRCNGTGPYYSKLGGRVVYAVADLLKWVKRGERLSTTDKVDKPIKPTHHKKKKHRRKGKK